MEKKEKMKHPKGLHLVNLTTVMLMVSLGS